MSTLAPIAVREQLPRRLAELARRGWPCPPLTTIEGAEVVGHDPKGFVVLRRPESQPAGPLHLRVRRGDSFAVRGGAWISLVCMLAIGVLIAGVTGRSVALRRRQDRRSTRDRLVRWRR